MSKTKTELLQLMQSKDLDQKTIDSLYNMVRVDPIYINYIADHLEKLGFVEHKSLAKELCTMDQGGVLETAIENTVLEKDFPKQAPFNMIDVCHSKGIILGADVLNYLLHFKPESNTTMGKGEALMRIIMKGIPTTNGDLGASGKKFEIKYNKSRLRGMTGFECMDASSVASTLDEYFIHECDSLGFDAIELIGYESTRWNFVSGKRLKPYLLSDIVKQSGMDPLYACKIFVQAYRKYFNQMTEDEALNLSLSLSKEFKDGSIKEVYGYSNFIYKMCAYSMKYYAKVEDFDGLIILNDQFDAMYITRDFIDQNTLESLSAFIKHNLVITTPSLTSKAGPQGSSFGIAL